MMKHVAITGGIGVGKSYVCRMLNERGVVIYDCDSNAKRLMNESRSLREKLIALIGPDAYADDRLNKAVVAHFLLASEDNKLAINAIVHPAVIEDFYSSGLQWMESAILFEAHLEHTVDYVICVTAPVDVRVERIVGRDGITVDKAREWIDCQISQDDVVGRSDAIIVNDGIMPLESQIDKVLGDVMKL